MSFEQVRSLDKIDFDFVWKEESQLFFCAALPNLCGYKDKDIKEKKAIKLCLYGINSAHLDRIFLLT
ncbi:hypothetical protein BpHYR1_041938 [Brachionus plicatilis]|uniref:Uncharacterized protein n=1 Tax=Brachionus plicatilis TaxID=10195 RepID=A0A3M7QTP5_BRAPC|nr:hypothetical protein BpHYR1_041938 [Brachionus plicatilis]